MERLQRRLASLKAFDARRAKRNQQLLSAADKLGGRANAPSEGAVGSFVSARAAAGREHASFVEETLSSFESCVSQIVAVCEQAKHSAPAVTVRAHARGHFVPFALRPRRI